MANYRQTSSEKILKKTVLVVDDHQAFRVGLAGLLEQNGYHAITAENGKECLISFYKNKPDIVIMDVSMPEMNGLDALKKIRENGDFTPILICTAYSYQSYYLTALAFGATGYIVKSISTPELLKIIEKALIGGFRFNELSDKMLGALGDFMEAADFINRLLEEYISLNKLNNGFETESISLTTNDSVKKDKVEAERISIESIKNYIIEKEFVLQYFMDLFLRLKKLEDVDKNKKSVVVSKPTKEIENFKAAWAAITHSLKNEFMNISFSIENLKELSGNTLDAQEESQVANRSLEYCRLISQRVFDLLDLNKTSYNNTDVLETIKKAEKLIRPRMPSNIQLIVEFDDTAEPKIVFGNSEQLIAVILELLTNATNSLRTSGGVLELKVGVDNNKVIILIKDNGPGIPKDIKKDLLRKQVPSKKGLGLGLFLSNKTIKLMGGKLGVRSSLSKGTQISITLPLSIDKEEI